MAEGMPTLAIGVKEFLDERGWRYQFDSQKNAFTLGLNIDSRLKKIDMIIQADEKAILVYGVCPIKADEGSMAVAAEFFARANYMLKLGNFDIDHRDGELRFNTCLVGRDAPSPDAIGHAIVTPFEMWKTFGDGLLAVLFGGASPEGEIRKIREKIEKGLSDA